MRVHSKNLLVTRIEMEDVTMKDTLLKMLKPFGPSGSEAPIAQTISEMITPYVDEIKTDAMGNLIAIKHGPCKRIMFSSHMDSIGYIALDADKEGFVRVSNIGGINVPQAAMRHVVFANGVSGVLCTEPVGKDAPTMSKLFVDIGAKDREAALAMVPIGTMCVVACQITEMGDLVSAPFMDDRAACAVLIELLKVISAAKHEVVAVFSSQEEVGCRGARAAAYTIDPDIGIAIDVTLAGDSPKCDPAMPIKVGKGPAVKVKDSYSISTPMVRDGLVEAAKLAKVDYQFEVLPFGGTDAGAIMSTRGGVPSGTLSIPCRYVHSPVETVSIQDMVDCVKVLKAYVEEIV